MENSIDNRIGKGLAWPIKITNGKPETATGLNLLKQSIQITLNWYFGTRYFLAEYGSKLEQLLEEPNDTVLRSSINYYLIESIKKWEPRVEIVKSSLSNISNDSISIFIQYKIAKTILIDQFTFEYKFNPNI
jgi:phage baseplate assembly protein W